MGLPGLWFRCCLSFCSLCMEGNYPEISVPLSGSCHCALKAISSNTVFVLCLFLGPKLEHESWQVQAFSVTYLFFFFSEVTWQSLPGEAVCAAPQQRQMYTCTLLNLSPDDGKSSIFCVSHEEWSIRLRWQSAMCQQSRILLVFKHCEHFRKHPFWISIPTLSGKNYECDKSTLDTKDGK